MIVKHLVELDEADYEMLDERAVIFEVDGVLPDGVAWCAFLPLEDEKGFLLATHPQDVYERPEEERWLTMVGPFFEESDG